MKISVDLRPKLARKTAQLSSSVSIPSSSEAPTRASDQSGAKEATRDMKQTAVEFDENGFPLHTAGLSQ
jgi:hypothetical protein